MKGIIFNIFENFIVSRYDEDTLDEIMEACDLITEDPFVAPGTYPDQDFMQMVHKGSELLSKEVDDFLFQLGHYALFELVGRYPGFVTPYQHPKEFLKTIEDVVHVEVRKLYSDTYLPTFRYQDVAPDKLIITYFSKRRLYPLMSGLIEGVGDHFQVKIEQNQRIYEKEGNEYCDFELIFERDGNNAQSGT